MVWIQILSRRNRLYFRQGQEGDEGFLVLLIAYSVNFIYCMHIPTQVMELVNTSSAQLYISPPQRCHVLNNTVGMLSSTGGSCGAALGSINFIAYFLQPYSLYAPTITSYHISFNCSHSCEILCIPMFYGCLLLQSLLISLFVFFFSSEIAYICLYLVNYWLWLMEPFI